MVKSSKNPDRVRGQSRDADNKNPDIIEWEEVEIDTDVRSREELEYELEEMAYREREAEQEKALSTLNAINSGLNALNNLLEFLNENPEVVEAIVVGGKHVKDFVSNSSRKLISGIRDIFSGKKKTKAEILLEAKKKQNPTTETKTVENIVVEKCEPLEEKEEMSIDEARALVLDILDNYINMKRNLERLSKARINDADFPQIDMNQVLAYMDTVVSKYPALMDEKNSSSVLDLLRSNENLSENKRIMETLKISFYE